MAERSKALRNRSDTGAHEMVYGVVGLRGTGTVVQYFTTEYSDFHGPPDLYFKGTASVKNHHLHRIAVIMLTLLYHCPA